MAAPPRVCAETVAAAAAAAAVGPAANDWSRARGPPEEDEGSDLSSLSSVPSMGRQMTELTEARCNDVMERQCSNFSSRGTEFWVRQNTAPAKRQNIDCIDALRRQISCPDPSPSLGMAPAFGRLDKIQDNGSDGSFEAGSRQVSQACDGPAEAAEVEVGLLESAICSVVTDCNFSVSVADPCSLDSDLIAVSEGFTRMTGYEREAVIGENCRFLNEGSPMTPEQRQRLKDTSETGTPFCGVVVNRKKDGKLFHNLLDLRGLVLARNSRTDEDIWVLLAIQMDITSMDRSKCPHNHFLCLKQVAGRIRKRLLKNLNELGLGSTVGRFRLQPSEGSRTPGKRNSGFAGSAIGEGSQECSWYLLMDTVWKPGPLAPAAIRAPLEDLPDLQTLEGQLPELVGLSMRVTTSAELLSTEDSNRPSVDGSSEGHTHAASVIPAEQAVIEPNMMAAVRNGDPAELFGAADESVEPVSAAGRRSSSLVLPATRWLVVGIACSVGALLFFRASRARGR